MPQAKRSTSTSRSRASFKQPASLKRLSRSLDAAHQALSELRKDTGRDIGKGSRDLYSGLQTFVSSARRDSGKLAKALQRDFDQAQKKLSKATSSTRSSRTTGRSAASSSTTKRSAAKRSTAKRSTAKRSATKS